MTADITPDERGIGIGDKIGTASAAVDPRGGNLAKSGPALAAGGIDDQHQTAQTGDDGDRLEESGKHCDCSQWTGRQRDRCEGVGREGRPDPTPESVRLWRSRNCERKSVQDGSPQNHWNLSQPSRGLGDTVSKVLHATGLDRLAPKGCGCKKRQAALNAAVPYRNHSGESVK